MSEALKEIIEHFVTELPSVPEASAKYYLLDGDSGTFSVFISTIEGEYVPAKYIKSLKTLRFFFGSGAPPSNYIQVANTAMLESPLLIGATIYGMCFLDNTPFDYVEQCSFNNVTGVLDLTIFGDMTTGDMGDGQKLVITIFS